MLHHDAYGHIDLARPLQTGRTGPHPVRQLVGRLLQPMDRTTFLWWLAVLVVCAAGASLHIWTSIQMAENGEQLAAIRAEYGHQERLNAELMWQISQHTALPQVQARATEMGFEQVYNNIYIDGVHPEAVATALTGRLPRREPLSAADEPAQKDPVQAFLPRSASLLLERLPSSLAPALQQASARARVPVSWQQGLRSALTRARAATTDRWARNGGLEIFVSRR